MPHGECLRHIEPIGNRGEAREVLKCALPTWGDHERFQASHLNAEIKPLNERADNDQ